MRQIFVLSLVSVLLCARVAFAAEAPGQIVVEVKSAKGVIISGAVVRVQDRAKSRPPLEVRSDATGYARFDGLAAGEYTVHIEHPDYENDMGLVTLVADAPAVYEAALDPKGQEQVIKVRAARLLVNPRAPVGNGQVRNATFITQDAVTPTIQGVASTTAGVQTNSLGQFHARGEHKGVSVNVDGVNVPLTTENATAQIIDPRFLDSMDIQTGYFDSSAGGQLGAVVNVTTKQGPQEPYVEFEPRVGTYGTYEGLLRAGGSNKQGDFNWFVGAAYGQTDNRLEPVTPDAQTLGNRGRDATGLIRLSKKTDADTLGLTLSYQTGRYGVPQTPQNFAAGVQQNQDNTNLLGVFSWKRAMTENADFLFGLSYLKSRVAVGNNGVYTPFTVISPDLSEELAASNMPADPSNPGSPYLPSYTLSVSQLQPSAEFSFRFAEDHRFKAGLTADVISSSQAVDILDAGGGGGLPNPNGDPVAPTRFNANIGRNGFLGGAYFTHTFPIKFAVVNWGVRADTFDNGATVRTGQVSPRVNVTIPTSDTAALRFSYNSLFQAPPLEIDPTGNTIVYPQRTHMYETSYEFQPAQNVVGRAALVYKDFRDQIDVGLLVPNSNVPVFAPLNFARAFYKGAELSLTTQYPFGWNGFLSSTVSVSKPTEPGPFSTELPAYNDHDQRVQVTAGASYTWKNGWSASLDALYGSGFPQEFVPLYNAVGIAPYGLSGSRFSRFITNLHFGWMPRDADGKPRSGVGFGVTVQNLFNNRSVLNFLSEFSGTRWVQGRRVLINGFFRF